MGKRKTASKSRLSCLVSSSSMAELLQSMIAWFYAPVRMWNPRRLKLARTLQGRLARHVTIENKCNDPGRVVPGRTLYLFSLGKFPHELKILLEAAVQRIVYIGRPYMSMASSKISHVITVLSGKGGVGKSSVTTQLALSLSLDGYAVGILDVDLTGPSIPRIFAVEDAQVVQSSLGWRPITVYSGTKTDLKKIGLLQLMSIGFLLKNRGDAVVWRGPKKTAMIRQFWSDVHWDALDFLLIDTPPGTSDEHISLLEILMATGTSSSYTLGAVIVTTPQKVATADVRKSLNFCRKTGLNVIGLIENMSGFVCPHCSHCTDLFSSEGGRVVASDFGIQFLGSVPIDPEFVMLVDGSSSGTESDALRTTEENQPSAKFTDPREDDRSVYKDPADCRLLRDYQECSLATIFSHITKGITKTVFEHSDSRNSNSDHPH